MIVRIFTYRFFFILYPIDLIIKPIEILTKSCGKKSNVRMRPGALYYLDIVLFARKIPTYLEIVRTRFNKYMPV